MHLRTFLIFSVLFTWILGPRHVQSLSVQAAEKIVLVAGGSTEATDIPATEAKLHEPFGAEWDRAGNLWIVEMIHGNRLLKVDSSGILHHVAGEFYSESEKVKSQSADAASQIAKLGTAGCR